MFKSRPTTIVYSHSLILDLFASLWLPWEIRPQSSCRYATLWNGCSWLVDFWLESCSLADWLESSLSFVDVRAGRFSLVTLLTASVSLVRICRCSRDNFRPTMGKNMTALLLLALLLLFPMFTLMSLLLLSLLLLLLLLLLLFVLEERVPARDKEAANKKSWDSKGFFKQKN